MPRVFKLTPNRTMTQNGMTLTPSMVAIVTTKSHTTSPFDNGATEVKETYMRLYGIDLQKMNTANKNYFTVTVEG